MNMEFLNDIAKTNGTWKLDDPYWYVRLDSMDHSSTGNQFHPFTSWHASGSVATSSADPGHAYFAWTGPTGAAVTYTQTIAIPETGKYLIEVMLTGNQVGSSAYELQVDGVSKWTMSAYQSWNDYGRIERLPIMNLTAGNRAFSFYVPAGAKVGWMRVIRIDRFEGGREFNGPTSTRLDLISAKFTENGVNEIDTMELQIAMKPEYFDFNGYNIIKFDLLDHITLALGESMDETVPMFGGYIGGWSLSDDSTVLTLSCVSRMWDLKRTHIMKNFFLGNAKVADDMATMPYTRFRTIQDAARYLCTALYAIDYSAINKDYVLYNTFSTAAEVSGLTSSGFEKQWTTNFGMNGSCMTLIPTRPGLNSITLYSDPSGTNWDAAVYDQFGFDYYASGAGVKYPVKFNLEIDMYRAEEDYTTYRTYVVQFTGPKPTGTKVLLKNVQALYNGSWQEVDFNLKDEFKRVAGSASYNIMAIRIVGSQDNVDVLNRRESGISVDNFIGYRSFDKSIYKTTTDMPNAFDELQDIMNQANYQAYIRPGMARSDDQLIVIPKYFHALPILLGTHNIKALQSMAYNPIGSEILNHVRGVFRYNDKRTGVTTQFNADHIKQYGPISQTIMLSGMTSLDNANTAAQKRLDALNAAAEKKFDARQAALKKKYKSYKEQKYTPISLLSYTPAELKVIDNQVDYLLQENIGTSQHDFLEFTLLINGTTLMEPGQYVSVYYPEKRVDGMFTVESIEHNLDFINGVFETTLGLNRPSGTFMNYMRTVRALEKRLNGIDSVQAFNSNGAITGGMETSRGAFS